MTIFVQPPVLKSGDKVAIVAPSGFVEKEYVEKTSKILVDWGLEVLFGDHLFAQHHQFAGNDEQRLSDLQKALDNEDIKAVICARGGYGLVRIVDQIHWQKFINRPKWVAGFSDITVLHAAIQLQGIQSLHSIMPINFRELAFTSKSLELFGHALFYGEQHYNLKPHRLNRLGTEKAVLVGGNLSILYGLLGTDFDLDVRGKILFIEDVGEQFYHIDRMIQSYRLAGKLEGLSGLIVGGLSEMEDKKRPFGRSPEEIIFDAVAAYDFPVVFNFPAGHVPENYPLLLGSEVALEVKKDSVSIKMGNGKA
jgi:muramoyltetrapeptide carboxypeptidase